MRRADRGEAPTASALVALLPAKAPATVLVCLGPPRWGVFMRVWPGLPLGPDGGAGEPHRCPLSILAARLAASGGEERAITIRGQLDEVEAEVLAEAADADRLAALMDAAGDDSGARVRRMLAEAYAIDRITAALTGHCPDVVAMLTDARRPAGLLGVPARALAHNLVDQPRSTVSTAR